MTVGQPHRENQKKEWSYAIAHRVVRQRGLLLPVEQWLRLLGSGPKWVSALAPEPYLIVQRSGRSGGNETVGPGPPNRLLLEPQAQNQVLTHAGLIRLFPLLARISLQRIQMQQISCSFLCLSAICRDWKRPFGASTSDIPYYCVDLRVEYSLLCREALGLETQLRILFQNQHQAPSHPVRCHRNWCKKAVLKLFRHRHKNAVGGCRVYLCYCGGVESDHSVDCYMPIAHALFAQIGECER